MPSTTLLMSSKQHEDGKVSQTLMPSLYPRNDSKSSQQWFDPAIFLVLFKASVANGGICTDDPTGCKLD